MKSPEIFTADRNSSEKYFKSNQGRGYKGRFFAFCKFVVFATKDLSYQFLWKSSPTQGCNLSFIVDLFAVLHELASARARTLLKLASSVRALTRFRDNLW